jgi:hypothetical protein
MLKSWFSIWRRDFAVKLRASYDPLSLNWYSFNKTLGKTAGILRSAG